MATYEWLPPLVGAVIGLLMAYFIVRRSVKDKPVYGGLPAQIVHYAASAIFGALPATALLTVLTGGCIRAVLLGFVLMGISLAVFVVFALIEAPAAARHRTASDDGWTAQKAKESGL